MAVLLKAGLCNGVDAVIKAYRLYLEQCPQAEEGPLLALTRARHWCGLLKVDYCNFPAATAAAAILLPTLISLLAALPAAYVNRHPGSKRRKLSQNPADIIPQLLDEQRVQAV